MIELALAILISQSSPNWMNGDPELVPNVIPTSMCVEAHTTEKGRKAGGKNNINIFAPPLDKENIRLLQQGRNRGLFTLKRCNSSNS